MEEAQAHGVQVVVLAVPTRDDRAHGVSRHLIRAADSVALVHGAAIDEAILKVEVPEPKPDSVLEDDKCGVNEPLPDGEASAGEPTVQTAGTPAPAIPTPNDLLARPWLAPSRPPRSVVAYTSSAAGAGGNGRAQEDLVEPPDEELIRAVAGRVLAAFDASATADERNALLRAKPSIPADIDRALLTDLSDVLEIYDVPESVRHLGRRFFWELADAGATQR